MRKHQSNKRLPQVNALRPYIVLSALSLPTLLSNTGVVYFVVRVMEAKSKLLWGRNCREWKCKVTSISFSFNLMKRINRIWFQCIACNCLFNCAGGMVNLRIQNVKTKLQAPWPFSYFDFNKLAVAKKTVLSSVHKNYTWQTLAMKYIRSGQYFDCLEHRFF